MFFLQDNIFIIDILIYKNPDLMNVLIQKTHYIHIYIFRAEEFIGCALECMCRAMSSKNEINSFADFHK